MCRRGMHGIPTAWACDDTAAQDLLVESLVGAGGVISRACRWELKQQELNSSLRFVAEVVWTRHAGVCAF